MIVKIRTVTFGAAAVKIKPPDKPPKPKPVVQCPAGSAGKVSCPPPFGVVPMRVN